MLCQYLFYILGTYLVLCCASGQGYDSGVAWLSIDMGIYGFVDELNILN